MSHIEQTEKNEDDKDGVRGPIHQRLMRRLLRTSQMDASAERSVWDQMATKAARAALPSTASTAPAAAAISVAAVPADGKTPDPTEAEVLKLLQATQAQAAAIVDGFVKPEHRSKPPAAANTAAMKSLDKALAELSMGAVPSAPVSRMNVPPTPDPTPVPETKRETRRAKRMIKTQTGSPTIPTAAPATTGALTATTTSASGPPTVSPQLSIRFKPAPSPSPAAAASPYAAAQPAVTVTPAATATAPPAAGAKESEFKQDELLLKSIGGKHVYENLVRDFSDKQYVERGAKPYTESEKKFHMEIFGKIQTIISHGDKWIFQDDKYRDFVTFYFPMVDENHHQLNMLSAQCTNSESSTMKLPLSLPITDLLKQAKEWLDAALIHHWNLCKTVHKNTRAVVVAFGGKPMPTDPQIVLQLRVFRAYRGVERGPTAAANDDPSSK